MQLAKAVDLLIAESVQRRSDDAGGDGVDADVVRRQFDGEIGGEGFDAPLGRDRTAGGQNSQRSLTSLASPTQN